MPQKVNIMELRPLTIHDIDAWSDLLACCFHQSSENMQLLIHWLYCLGNLEAYGIWDHTMLVSQYCCLQRPICFQSHTISSAMSMNMAVHRDYRGQGLIKQTSHPVYETLRQKQTIFGIGFSNAEGVQVDRHSQSYGYQVIGQMQPLIIKTKSFSESTIDLMDHLPDKLKFNDPFISDKWHFPKTTSYIYQRYYQHPFRNYRYAIWSDQEEIMGLVVYKDVRLLGIPAVALLDVISNYPDELLMRWSTTIAKNGTQLIHILTSPHSTIRKILKKNWLTFDSRLTRNPYYLTIKPLSDMEDLSYLDFDRWDLIGGDVL